MLRYLQNSGPQVYAVGNELALLSLPRNSYPEWVLHSSRTVKKYDRNCFFSPVQCMLSFNHAQEHPIVFTGNGKRFYYRK
ncbi:unnamed protein product [Angiostrongylus costaricensis]|uniref:Glycosyltransferase n=1 Tax=Angiostrongylus costaricensis TaxID=334426 RepID=A0A0R3PCY8_ANGCS|nr:unnamed protein product [Angiostrongylus costaricensis]